MSRQEISETEKCFRTYIFIEAFDRIFSVIKRVSGSQTDDLIFLYLISQRGTTNRPLSPEIEEPRR